MWANPAVLDINQRGPRSDAEFPSFVLSWLSGACYSLKELLC
jgi:hypothetical protein